MNTNSTFSKFLSYVESHEKYHTEQNRSQPLHTISYTERIIIVDPELWESFSKYQQNSIRTDCEKDNITLTIEKIL